MFVIKKRNATNERFKRIDFFSGAAEIKAPGFFSFIFVFCFFVLRSFIFFSFFVPRQYYCRVTPYRLENLSLLLHTSETRSLPRIAVKRWIAKRAKMRKDAQRRPKTRKQKDFKTFFWRLAKLTEELAGGRVGYRKTHKIQTLNPILAYLKYFWY